MFFFFPSVALGHKITVGRFLIVVISDIHVSLVRQNTVLYFNDMMYKCGSPESDLCSRSDPE